MRLLASEPLTKVACDPRIGETRTSDFLARNPNGRVPTLEEDGFVLISPYKNINAWLERLRAKPYWKDA